MNDKFHQDVCAYYSKKVENVMQQIGKILNDMPKNHERLSNIRQNLADITRKCNEKELELNNEKCETSKQRARYLKMIRFILDFKVNSAPQKAVTIATFTKELGIIYHIEFTTLDFSITLC